LQLQTSGKINDWKHREKEEKRKERKGKKEDKKEGKGTYCIFRGKTSISIEYL